MPGGNGTGPKGKVLNFVLWVYTSWIKAFLNKLSHREFFQYTIEIEC